MSGANSSPRPEFERESDALRRSTHSGRPLGSARFVERLETALARPLARARAEGRKRSEPFRHRRKECWRHSSEPPETGKRSVCPRFS